jgi:hypothetical protein
MEDKVETLFSDVISTLRKYTNSINRKNIVESRKVEKFLKDIIFKTKRQLEGYEESQRNLIVNSKLRAIKGELLRGDMNDKEINLYLSWISKLLRDTISHNKDIVLLREYRYYNKIGDIKESNKIKKKRKSLEPVNYPKNLSIGDIVYLQCGFGYCGEINTNHYAIIMSEIKNQMYFIVPLSSDELRLFPYSLKGLNLPNSAHDEDKISYVRFDQARFVHYRRIENIRVNDTVLKRSVKPEDIIEINKKFLEFMNFQLTTGNN